MSNFRLVLVLLAVGVLATFAASAQTEHYTVSGDFASTTWSNGYQYGDIFVSADKQGNTITNRIQFNVWYTPTYIMSGYGTIPKDAFTGNVGGGMTLNLDMAAFQGEIQSCDYSVPNVSFCGPVTVTGVIQAQWARTRETSYASKFTTTNRMPGRQIKEVGMRDGFSAVASGNILGLTFSNAYAYIGTSHNVSIDIQKVK